MKVLNIGGTGFVGSVTTRKLLERGAEVICADALPSPHRVADLGVEIMPADITDFAQLAGIIADRKIDTVLVTAALLSSQAEREPLKSVQVNALGTTNVFEAARLFGVRRVVYLSSVAAYSTLGEQHPGVPLREDMSLPAGNSAYSCEKQLNEYLAGLYSSRWGIEMYGVRPASVLGLGRTTGARPWLSELIEAPVQGCACKVPLPPEAGVTWVYVDDLAEILAELLCKEKPRHAIYNAVAGTATAGEIVDIAREMYPSAQIDFDVPAQAAHPHFADTYDNARTREDLGVDYLSLRAALRLMGDIAEAKRG
jgi:UDP-glucose 4-epimerase